MKCWSGVFSMQEENDAGLMLFFFCSVTWANEKCTHFDLVEFNLDTDWLTMKIKCSTQLLSKSQQSMPNLRKLDRDFRFSILRCHCILWLSSFALRNLNHNRSLKYCGFIVACFITFYIKLVDPNRRLLFKSNFILNDFQRQCNNNQLQAISNIKRLVFVMTFINPCKNQRLTHVDNITKFIMIPSHFHSFEMI